MSTLEERLKELERYPVRTNQPVIEASTEYVSYEIGSFSNPLLFADRNGFQTRFAKEAETIARLQNILHDGEYFVHTLYTYRSISRALPQVKPDTPDKAMLYRKMFDVLIPETQKIRDFLQFHLSTVSAVSQIVVDVVVAEKNKEIPSDSLLDILIQVFDMILKLDALKNMKAAISNDYAAIKRAAQFMDRTNLDPNIVNFLDPKSEENQQIFNFNLSNSIISGLREELSKNSGFDDVVTLILERCANNFESERFLFCDEKYCFLRVIVLVIYLIDKIPNVYKKLPVSRIIKLFKQYPCVPLYGDMTFTIKTILKSCPNLGDEWQLLPKDEEKLAREKFLLIYKLPQIRRDFSNFTTRFTLLTNKIKNHQKINNTSAVLDPMRVEAKQLSEQGIKLIALWTTNVLEQAAWKFSHPAETTKIEAENPGLIEARTQEINDKLKDNKDNAGSLASPTDPDSENGKRSIIKDYERVVRFNYTAEERAALVDTIAIIKGLEGIMLKYTSLLAPLIRRQIHVELQEFAQVTLFDMLARTKEKKRPVHQTVLELRNIAADWLNGSAPQVSDKKKKESAPKSEHPVRHVGPSSTQLHMIRSIISTLISDRAPGMTKSGFFGATDFSDKQVEQMQSFYDRSTNWNHLLNYNATLRRCSDLADLWYREFYLEISKEIQFPIEMSLPWILTEDILEKGNTTLMESIIYPINLYNDAAYRALFTLQRRFLYDEVEAEVNLVFDQLVYKLSEQIYSYYKMLASNILLDTQFRTSIEKMQKGSGPGRFDVPKSRFDVLLRQKHINILGRYIDLNALLAQRLNISLRENIHKAIQKFESSPLSSVVELENNLLAIRICRDLLKEHDLNVDSYESIFSDVNESTSMVSFEGRIARHVTEELIMDLFATHVFNTTTERLVPAKITYISEDSYERDKAPRIPIHYQFATKSLNNAFNHIHEQYKRFIGRDHIASMLRLVGNSSMALVIETCVAFIMDKVNHDLSPFVAALMEAIPPKITLQSSAYKLRGVYGYFRYLFRDFVEYDELKPGVFQAFRVVGNAIAFIHLLDLCGASHELISHIQSCSFLGMKPLSKQGKEKRDLHLNSEHYGDANGAHVSNLSGDMEDFLKLAQPSDLFIRSDIPSETPLVKAMNDLKIESPAVCGDLKEQATRAAALYQFKRGPHSLLKMLMGRLSTCLDGLRSGWKGDRPADRLQKLDASKEFYRLWGILQFVFCLPEGDTETKNEDMKGFELFGDGFFWAGCSIVYLFDQQLRFDAFNFSDHVLNISVSDQDGIDDMKEFLRVSREVRLLNDRIFNTLRAVFPMKDAPVEMFEAPITEDFARVKIVSSVTVENTSDPVSARQSVSFRKTQSVIGRSESTSSPVAPTMDIPPPPPL
ncbi:Rac-binding component of scar regulatory complex [Acrasis kona]|uniref:Rac-binding component of scar regulatory complex n=1 Tax=Acrasis kona TaxID=1008807 RepID=A0AAW2ZRR1_9EUKA